MLAQFSVWPLEGQPVDATTARTIKETLEGLNVKYDVGAMGTTVDGDWDQVMAAILACHQAVAISHSRVLTQITLDDKKSTTGVGDEAVSQAQMVEGLDAEP